MGGAVSSSLSFFSEDDTLILKVDSTGKTTILVSLFTHYSRYYVPASKKYEEQSELFWYDEHWPLDYRVLMRISAVHIILRKKEFPIIIQIHSIIPLTDEQIEELRKDILFDTQLSPLYNLVEIYSSIRI